MLARTAWLGLGVTSLVLGIVGAFLPILPTTPFVLLAAYCFSRSSPRLHQWMLHSPFFGPIIADWERGGIIRLPAKVAASTVILISFASLTVFAPAPWGVIVALDLVAACVLIFIWSRPMR